MLLRIAGAFALVLPLGPGAFAQKDRRPEPHYLQLGRPDQAEGGRILEQFRAQGISGDYYLEFQLEVMPRRGAGRVLHGRLWGTRSPSGPLTRVGVDAAGGAAAPEVRFLVQGGPQPALWEWAGSGDSVTRAGVDRLFAPVAGTDLTPFDLQMPFLYWPEFTYEGLARLRGRPAHQFLLYPPADVAARHPEIAGVRVYLDTQYGALVEAEMIGEGGRELKTLSLIDLKKVEGQWIVKSIDLRDDTTRNKTRFEVTAAALGQHFPGELFEPEALARPASAPAAGLVQLGP